MKFRVLLTVALAVAALPIQAVRLDPSGLGQALIYPYYTVRQVNNQSWNLLFSVTNTRFKPKVVKVRFRESLHGRVVKELNVYLGPYDMWTGALITNSDGKAEVITADTSCTDPASTGGHFDPFSTAAFSGSAADGASTGVDRTVEGWVEMIEMGTLATTTAEAVTVNVPTGVPSNCAAVVGAGKSRIIEAPEGGLSGGGYLINVNTGLASAFDAVALADLTQASFYSDIGQPGTDFDSPQVTPISIVTVPASSTTGFGTSAQAYLLRSAWSRGVDAVSAVFMTSAVTNEYVLDAATGSDTDWVMTLPTARFYVDGAATAPFTNTFSAKGACENVSATYYNREQARGFNPSSGCEDMGCPGPPTPVLCWAANIIPWSGYTPMGSTSRFFGSPGLPVNPFSNVYTSFQNGFAMVNLSNAYVYEGHGLTSLPSSTAVDLSTGNVVTGAHQFKGLPVTGFSSWSFNIGVLDCGGQTCRGTFGMSVPQRALKSVMRINP